MTGTPLGRNVLRLLTPQAGRVGLAAITAAIADLAGLVLMATAAWLIVRAAEQPPMAALAVAIVAVRALAIGRGVFRYAERLTGHHAALDCLAELRSRVFTAVIPQSPLGLSSADDRTTSRADLLTRLVSDVDAVQDLLLRCLVPAAAAAAVGGVAVTATTFALPSAAAVLAAGLVLAGIVLPVLAARLSTKAAERSARTRADLAASTVDLVHGAADLAAYGATGPALQRAEAATARLRRLETRSAAATSAVHAAGVLTQVLTTLAITALASGQLPGPLVAALALGSLAATEAVLPLVAAAPYWAKARTALRRLAAVVFAPPALAQPVDPVRPAPVPLAPVDIQLRGVQVRYRSDRRPALAGVDLDLPAGSRTALVGPSGSGKSTLLAVLARFVEYERGHVLLNGTDLRELRGDDVRRIVGGALGDLHIFHTTVRANLELAAPGVSQQRLDQVAEQVQLTEWLHGLPNGWDTVVGEQGDLLSGGQRQRLVLARALLAEPAVLLLDEPTEGLDPALADEVLTTVLEASAGRTVVVATHRLTDLHHFDQVITLDPSPAPGLLVP